jgi:hypothetical protein
MAFGLSPLVRGRRAKGRILIVVFTASMIATAAAVGAVLGLVGRPLSEMVATLPALGAVALLGLLIELKVVPLPAPYRHWQVPRDWPQRFGPWRGYALWGATLGLGIVSYIPFVSYHVFIACMLLSGGLAQGAAFGILYGAGRTLASLLPAIGAARHPDQFRDRAAAALDRERLHRGLQLTSLFALAVALGLGASFGVGG